MNARLQVTELPEAVAKARAVFLLRDNALLALVDDTLGVFDDGKWRVISSAKWPEDECQKRWIQGSTYPEIEVSPNQRFAAIYTQYGRYGFVFDLQTASLTLKLDRGNYHSNVQRFPVAFFEHNENELVIHGTDWNRLDISDAASGELLTAREPTSYLQGEPRPQHYLDYFYGGIHVSPNKNWIVSDSWVWHPFAVTRRWDLGAWLENPWESEDGASQVCFDVCGGWDLPMTWVGNERFAVVDCDEHGIKTTRVFDAQSTEETLSFQGPNGEIWSDGARLFADSPVGLQIWDLQAGKPLDQIDGFHPQFWRDGRFVEIENRRMRSWQPNA